jgi:hypothetical protein
MTLTEMARAMVGDGKDPNLYFVTDEETSETFAVCAEFESAEVLASRLATSTVIEDRKEGVVWTTEHGREIAAWSKEREER